jgi:hypothetical protein
MVACKVQTSLEFHTTNGETLLSTLPDALRRDDDWVVIGHGEADALAAVVSGATVRVWSSITTNVVASLMTEEPPTLLEFDLHVVAAVFSGKVWLSHLSSLAEPSWHAMCSSTNTHSLVPCWPHVAVLNRDGASLAITNLSANLSDETAPAVIVHVGTHSTTRSHQQTRTRSLGLYQTASTEPAFAPTPRTPACVGRLTIVDGVVQWVAMSYESRRLRLLSAPLATLTQEVSALGAITLPWSISHKDKHPSTDNHMCHVRTMVSGKEHIHVTYFAEDASTGKKQQMITSLVGGDWHKTYVIAGSKPILSLAETERNDTIALLFAGGGHATLKTVPNMH